MTDTTVQTATSGTSGFFTTQTLQKAVAFVVLIALIAFFSVFASNFATGANMVGIMQATAVNGVLGVAGIILTNLGMPLPVGIIGAILSGAFMGAISGATIAKLKIPPFIATLGMMQIARGLALVFSEAKPIYFNDTPNYGLLSPESSITKLIPGIEIPNGVMIMFIVAIIAS
jgi:ribose transport system permease protein